MKKVLLTIAAAFTFAAANAQTEAGTLFIGGGLGVSNSVQKTKSGGNTADGPKTFNIGISPQAGFYIVDNFALRLGLDFNSATTTTTAVNGDETKNIANVFGANVGGRYVVKVSDNFGFFGELALGFYSGKSKVKSGGNTADGDKLSGFGVGVYPGIIFFPNEKIGIEAVFGGINSGSYLLGLTSNTTKSPNDDKTTTTAFGFGFNTLPALQLGFNYYFGGK